jgi:hypothetical protein
MATIGIESNGRLEKTAIYYNGEQIAGLKEFLLNLDESGTFDAVIQYEGTDKEIYTKNAFLDDFSNIRYVEPTFTEEEARSLSLLEIQSDGDIENTIVALDGEELSGLVSLFLHLRSASAQKTGLLSMFSSKKEPGEGPVFKAEFVFRNEDESLSTENIF